jgi:hypothetical protein
MSCYKDPDNVIQILENLRQIPNLNGILQLIDEIYPKWIISFIDDYSPDYRFLKEGWEHICDESNTKPTQIMIVDCISMDVEDPTHSLIRALSELFTLMGFSVRGKAELYPCSVCSLAIPQKSVYDYFKNNVIKGKNVPTIWSKNCIGCQDKLEISH